MSSVLSFSSESEMRDFLEQHQSLDVSSWSDKAYEDLYTELKEEESQLILKNDISQFIDHLKANYNFHISHKTVLSAMRGEINHLRDLVKLAENFKTLIRMCTVCKMQISHPHNENFILIESHRVLRNKEVVPRVQKGIPGISEKAKPHELPIDTALRCLEEELNITDYTTCMTKPNFQEDYVTAEKGISNKYPGLKTTYIILPFTCFVTSLSQFIKHTNGISLEFRPDGEIGIYCWVWQDPKTKVTTAIEQNISSTEVKEKSILDHSIKYLELEEV